MARLMKVGSSRLISSQGQKNVLGSVNKPPSKNLIIPAREVVQILAKERGIQPREDFKVDKETGFLSIFSQLAEKTQASKYEDSQSSKKEGPDNGGLSPNASYGQKCGNAGPPSNMVGAQDSKGFKLNPNAESFIPTHTPLRPASPVSDSSYYYLANVAAVPHIYGMPVGIGIEPSFGGQQPVMFNPQAASVQSPLIYFHPDGRQHGQQMFLGQPLQVLYMPNYPWEMEYK